MNLKKIFLATIVAVFMAVGPAWAGDTVNVNTATAKELQKINGIGEKTAAKIIAYRNEYGPFKSVDDLLHIKGIGKKKLAKAKDELSVDDDEENNKNDDSKHDKSDG
ncbi:MAG: helix-hairpin-helix domain-containing protein [Mariprofundaceae bacterium]|nr:helix-hairpin-helix domain-containing protein [Mariprofundaceae bacterium]